MSHYLIFDLKNKLGPPMVLAILNFFLSALV